MLIKETYSHEFPLIMHEINLDWNENIWLVKEQIWIGKLGKNKYEK